MDRPFSCGRACYIPLRIWELPEQLALLLAAAKDILRHLLGTVRDFRSRQLTSADQPKGAFEARMMCSTRRKSCISRNTVAKHMRLLEEHGLIITEWTQIQMKNGIRKNGNLRCTIVPMHEVLEQCYQRQMTELERQRMQQKLSVQSTETICPPL